MVPSVTAAYGTYSISSGRLSEGMAIIAEIFVIFKVADIEKFL
jgi:hypothetical protein